MKKYIEYIKNNNLGEVYLDKMFKDVTTIKIGGKIKLLYYPNSIESFLSFYRYYLEDKICELIVIGNGSNVLASSKDYNGIVVSFKKCIYKFSLCNNIVSVNSGVMMMDLINSLKKSNLGGLESLSYIPATVGGMVKMNAGAYHFNCSDRLIEVICADGIGDIKVLKKDDIRFGYRTSSIPNDYIILECVFILEYKDKEIIEDKIRVIRNSRNMKQPINEYNAGSTFKNTLPTPSWKLIESVGLRGYKLNDAIVSEKHCNFLINKGDCNSDDMIELIKIIKQKVNDRFKTKLECEWIFINF